MLRKTSHGGGVMIIDKFSQQPLQKNKMFFTIF
jgi:hypothetical protein